MLKISKIQSSTASSHYYEKDDYYAKDDPEHKKCSQWYGKLTNELNLKGQIDKKDFLNILEGKLPNGQTLGNKVIVAETKESKDKITGEIKEEIIKKEENIHDKGRDFIFSAPKSVSIAGLVYNNNQTSNNSKPQNLIIKSHEDAVKSTINYIEKNYLTFRTKDKQSKEITHHQSQKLISALFRHHSNREQDPQLHTHAVIANIAHDKDNINEYRCASFDKAYEDSKFLGAIYRSYLAKNLTDLGYEIQRTNNLNNNNTVNSNSLCFFELKEISNHLNILFSKRSQQIKEIAGNNKNSKFLDKLALFTRKDKKENENINTLKQLWQAEAKKELNIKNFNFTTTNNNPNNKPTTIKDSLSYAINHLSQQSVVFARKDIISHALDHNIGKYKAETVEKEISRNLKTQKQLLLSTKKQYQNLYTTKHALETEKQINKSIKEGINKKQPIVKNYNEQNLIDKYKSTHHQLINTLNKGQKQALGHILSTKDNISAITGLAGTGKSYMLKVAYLLTKQETNNKHHFTGLAPSAIATNHLRDSAYIQNCQTLQYFLTKYDGYANGRGTNEGKELTKAQFKDRTIIIDEASMISLKQMKDLFTISKELDLKVILMGDQKQLDAVEAGNPFKLITENHKSNNITITNIDQIVRQENEQLKTAVQSIVKQDVKQTIKNLTTVIEVANDNRNNNNQDTTQKTQAQQPIDSNKLLQQKAVEAYLNQPISKRQNTLILTTNNKLKDQINEEISKAILEERRNQNANKQHNQNILQKITTTYQNFTTKQEQEKQILKAQNITKAQASQAFNYQRNQTIIFNKEVQKLAIKKDDQYHIINIDNNKNILFLAKQNNITKTKEFDLNKLQESKENKNTKLPFNLFNKQQAIFRSKDQIIFNKNLKTAQGQKIINSQIATIDKIKRNGDYVITLGQKQDNKPKQQNQNTIIFKANDPNLQHISHYYACTTHKAQGLTTDYIIAVNNSQDRKELLTQKNFYVQISRAKQDVTLITDNVKKTQEKLNVNIGDKITGYEHQGVAERVK